MFVFLGGIFALLGACVDRKGTLAIVRARKEKKKNCTRMLANARNNRSIPLIINGSPKSANVGLNVVRVHIVRTVFILVPRDNRLFVCHAF